MQMSKSTNKLHGIIGDYLREIEKIKKAAKEGELPKAKIDRIVSLRKMIVSTANKLQKGMGW
jgi:hypothetical protein